MMKCFICLAVLCMVLCASVYAGYMDNMSRKADRGFSNVLGCWLELPYQPYAVTKEKGLIQGATIGVGKGIVMIPLRALSGVADLVTFPVACPLCGWDGCIKPQYNPWVEEPQQPLDQPPAAAPAQPAGEQQVK